jgi:Arc/MetJ family transcription regulator
MRKHTTIDLDMVLVGEAAVALETKRVNETVHAALQAVVDARRRLRLLEFEPDLTLAQLADDRRGRFEEVEEPADGAG